MSIDVEKIIRCYENPKGKVTLGIDGYIDEVWQIIDARISKTEYTVFDSMKQFAERILRCGSGGMGNEIVRKRRSFGGFTANTGNAVSRLGVETVMLCMYGKDRIDSVFEEFERTCRVISIGEPAISQIFEFTDGKIMLPYIKEIMDFDWNTLISALDLDALKAVFAESEVVAFGYWSGMPAFDELVTNLCEKLIKGGRTKRLFFDFADIKKRDEKSFADTVEVLRRLNPLVQMTLSLNEHEAADVFARMGEEYAVESGQVRRTIENVRAKIGLDELIVHTPWFAAAASRREGVAVAPQEHCEKPVRTTGAGDTFNGGYVSACLGDLDLAERLLIGNCTTGFFVRNGYSPDKDELAAEIKRQRELVYYQAGG